MYNYNRTATKHYIAKLQCVHNIKSQYESCFADSFCVEEDRCFANSEIKNVLSFLQSNPRIVHNKYLVTEQKRNI